MKRIFYAGDSTVTFNKIDSYPQAGLSQGLQYYLREDVFVYSFAVNGRSTKSFIDEGRLEAIDREIREGDFLFIQFGHNDEKESDPLRYAPADTLYKENLERFVRVAWAHGALPLIISPVARRLFDAQGRFLPGSHGAYPEAAAQAAGELAVPFIDLTARSEAYLAAVGDTASRPMYVYPKDNSHFQLHGAVVMAGFIAQGLRDAGGEYAKLLISTLKKDEADVVKLTGAAFKDETV